MATLTITAASFQLACAECADALAASDFVTATTKYAVAEAINAGMDVAGQADGVSARRRESLEGLAKAIETAAAATRRNAGRGRLITTQTRFPR